MITKTTNRIRLSAVSALVLFSATGAFAASSVDELDKRVQSLEQKMDAIIELLQKQSSQPAASSAPGANDSSEPAPPPAGIQMGAMYLDLYLLDMTDQLVEDITWGRTALPSGPSNAAVESAVVKSASTLKWGAFKEQSSMARYMTTTSSIQQSWTGVLEIRKDGPHLFAVEISKTGNNHRANACRSVLRINDKSVVDVSHDTRVTNGNFGSGSDYNVSQQGQVDLVKGLYDFGIFMTCIGHREDATQNTTVSVRFREPGDRVPKAIPTDRLGIRQ